MSRHTLSDGITPDPEITSRSFNQWWKDLAPPPQLVGAYYRQEIGWEEFATRYNNYLDGEDRVIALQKAIAIAQRHNLTLLCVEDSPEKCHRRLIAERCLQIAPELEVELG